MSTIAAQYPEAGSVAATGICCSPPSRPPMPQEQAEYIVPMLKALADPVRLRLTSLVASYEPGAACVCDLVSAFNLSQPTISHHLKVLHETGLLKREKRGVWVFYSVQADALNRLAGLIGDLSPDHVAS
jgi:ArsR family transcriptional regulator